MAYKADQGRYTRLAAFWSLALLTFYGCYSFRDVVLGQWVSKVWPAVNRQLFASMKKIPVLGLELTPAFLISLVLLAVLLWLLNRWLHTPKVADLLIETETELRKVTWPTMPEAVNSSIVVIVCVVFLMAFLASADWVLGQWATRILTGGKG